VLVGMFFASRLYRLRLLTIGDFYRRHYGQGIEIFASTVISLSYLGWVAAQITALGLVLEVLTQGLLSTADGMLVGTLVVLIYTALGGMWSIALADLFQMTVMVLGLMVIAVLAGQSAGGAGAVWAEAQHRDLLRFFPEGDLTAWLAWLAAAITLMIGSIPQQDVFQRVMAARDERTARLGPIIGGSAYMVFAAVPIFLGVAAMMVVPTAETLLAEDAEQLIPTLVLSTMPLALQVLFFGALLSAIMSTASATLLAPTTTFVENILMNLVPAVARHRLQVLRWTLVLFALAVLIYARAMEGTPIYDLVGKAYQFPVVGAFWPLALGLYWAKASREGALCSIAAGLGVWSLLEFTVYGQVMPSVLGGFFAGGLGMVLGSLRWPSTRPLEGSSSST
ncbi:MAG: sodium:solute symporter family protein, partial [Pseudomonadota bacterium]|nr:sodium:solute symporter family protein [Pseudomonadota bacterium]